MTDTGSTSAEFSPESVTEMTKTEFKNTVTDSLFPVLNDAIYEYVLTLIIEHHFVPGEKINMTQIADDLEVSRSPVRAALERLADEGLVVRTGQKGYATSKIEWDDCLALYKTRELIEGFAAYEAADKITLEGLAGLERIISRSKKHSDEHNLIAFLQDDFDFHREIVVLAGNSHLLRAYDSLSIWIRSYQHLIRSYQTEEYIQQVGAIEKHIAICKSLKAHHALEAKDQAERHIQHIYFSLASLISKNHQ